MPSGNNRRQAMRPSEDEVVRRWALLDTEQRQQITCFDDPELVVRVRDSLQRLFANLTVIQFEITFELSVLLKQAFRLVTVKTLMNGNKLVTTREPRMVLIVNKSFTQRDDFFDQMKAVIPDFLHGKAKRSVIPKPRWKELLAVPPSSVATMEEQLVKLVEQTLWAMGVSPVYAKLTAALPHTIGGSETLGEVAVEPWMIDDDTTTQQKKKTKAAVKGKKSRQQRQRPGGTVAQSVGTAAEVEQEQEEEEEEEDEAFSEAAIDVAAVGEKETGKEGNKVGLEEKEDEETEDFVAANGDDAVEDVMTKAHEVATEVVMSATARGAAKNADGEEGEGLDEHQNSDEGVMGSTGSVDGKNEEDEDEKASELTDASNVKVTKPHVKVVASRHGSDGEATTASRTSSMEHLPSVFSRSFVPVHHAWQPRKLVCYVWKDSNSPCSKDRGSWIPQSSPGGSRTLASTGVGAVLQNTFLALSTDLGEPVEHSRRSARSLSPSFLRS